MEWTLVKVPFSTDTEDGLIKSKGPEVILSDYYDTEMLTVSDDDSNMRGWINLSKKISELSVSRPIFIAGECTVTTGVVGWLQKKYHSFHILWLDAHADMNTPEVSRSGILSGMPLGWILGRFSPTEGEEILHPINKDNLTLLGTRDLDADEKEYIDRHDIFTRANPSPEIMHRTSELKMPIYLHIDLDVLDPKENPAVSNPVPGGITLNGLIELICTLKKSSNIVAVSIASYNYKKDINHQGLTSVIRILKELGVKG